MKFPEMNLKTIGVFTVAALSLFLPVKAFATSASISVSGNEGRITVSAQASFSSYETCTGSGEDEVCTTNDSGTLGVRHGSNSLGGDSGDGSASWSGQLNAAVMAQGEHTFYATARDSRGETDTASQTITIDNTPEVSITAGNPEGEMNAKGTVDFKDNPDGNEGVLSLYIDYKNDGAVLKGAGSKAYEGSGSISWTWEEITGDPLNAGTLPQGTHALIATAKSANNTSKTEKHIFTIDNTPEVTITADNPEGDMKAKGTVDFKDNPGGNEGVLSLYIDYKNDGAVLRGAGSKAYEDSGSISWTWEEITGDPLNAGTLPQGTHALIATAKSANNTSKTEKHVFTIDNTPRIRFIGVKHYDDQTMDVMGTTTFIENLTGNEGTIAVYYKDAEASSYKQYGGTIGFDETTVTWKFSDFSGTRMSKAFRGDKEMMFKAVATAANGATASAEHTELIQATGTCPDDL